MAGPLQSDIRNRLLAALSPEDFERVGRSLEHVELPFRQVLARPGEPIRHVHFPDAGVVSVIASLQGGGRIEVGMIGRDNMVGIPVVLGADTLPYECLVQISGAGWRMDAQALREAMDCRASIRGALLLGAMAFLAQVSQTAACNGAHRLAQRLARWLLMSHDRGDGDDLPLTQDLISTMLGVRRSGVTVAAGAFQKAGLIRYAGGRIEILNRAGLETVACECYGVVRAETDRLQP